MALAGSITLSAARISGIFDVSNLAQAAIAEGAAVAYQTAATDDNDVILPSGSNASNIAGVSMGAGSIPLGTSVAGADFIAVQKLGRAKVLLAAGATVTRGQQCVVANAFGHCTARTAFGPSATVLGFWAQNHTAGATAEYVMVDLAIAPVEVVQPIAGTSVTAIGAATKYLVAPGVPAASATVVVLFTSSGIGTLRNLVVSATTAAGGADTGIVTVQRNPWSGTAYTGYVDTTLTATLTASGPTAFYVTDALHTTAVGAGDLIAIKVVSSGTLLAGVSASVMLT